MPNTFKAFKRATALVQYTWKSYANGNPIKGSSVRLKNPTGAYMRSIKVRYLSPINTEIYSDSPIALYIEKGTREYDMKKKHPKGKRSRVNKKGVPYLIIPFRHGVPGTKSYAPMPEQMFQKVEQVLKQDEKALSQRIKGHTHSPNFKGDLVPRAKYKWGTRFQGTGLDQLEGLIAMNMSTGPKEKRSEYMTFRVISANSPAFKWIMKARPAKNITKHVVINTAKPIADMISAGLRMDMGLSK